MPVIDMPLEELKTYQGRNPRPDDFDAYWQRALDELATVDPDVEITPADDEMACPFADCFHMTFTGVRGGRIYAKLLKPKGVDKPAAGYRGLVNFHGYSMNSGDWSDLLRYAAAGFVVAAMDCRGQGGRSTDPGGVVGNTLNGHIIRGLADGPDELLFRHIMLDSAQLANLIMDMPDVDASRVGACGGSQGGGLTLACAALVPTMNRAAPAFPFLCDFQRVWEIDLGKGAYQELRDFFRRFDPMHEQETTWFTHLGYIDNQHLAHRIQARIMMVTCLMDDICPPSTQFAAYNKITVEKEVFIYPDYGHERMPGWEDRVFKYMLAM